jgi:hypothetical protein
MNIALLLAVMATTPQVRDTLEYGNRDYLISEMPMLGLWDYCGAEPADGKTKPPDSDFAGSANWAGYEAVWLVRDSKLYLKEIKANRDGKPIKNAQILPGKKFPLQADWFSGRIHLEVGGYNESKESSESVIIFHVEKGNVVATTFEPELKIQFEWNGMPFEEDVQQE